MSPCSQAQLNVRQDCGLVLYMVQPIAQLEQVVPTGFANSGTCVTVQHNVQSPQLRSIILPRYRLPHQRPQILQCALSFHACRGAHS
jgi:hypothetical protein